MMNLDLVYPENSDIEYNIVDFSDSQRLLTISNPKRVFLEESVTIKSRMSWTDLQIISQAVVILRNLRVQRIQLFIPYFLGARSDRRFNEGGVNYIKEIMSKFINSLNVDEVIVQDPHSLAVDATVNNLTITSQYRNLLFNLSIPGNKYVLISPDEGSIKRTEELGGGYIPVVKCVKEREPSTGKIISTNVLTDDLKKKTCVVIDDICDGGATFLSLAESLKAKNAGDLYLVISHGIFSKGFDDLLKHYKHIITTNSVKDFEFKDKINVTILNAF